MVLSQPDRVVTRLFHDIDTLEDAFIHAREDLPPLWPTEELQDSKFHVVMPTLYDARSRCFEQSITITGGEQIADFIASLAA
jgi:hypothetical protein